MSGRQYLEFKKANCKDCYRCLRGCPVKAKIGRASCRERVFGLV